jgi:uracil-DNA glycosylase family 4
MRRNRDAARALNLLAEEIVACERCPRLRSHCRAVGETKRRAYRDWDYWARPVPGFGDPQARVLIIGLAPGAHGANRTGRMFTGDRSGDFLYRALYETGFASQPLSHSRDDGLQLHGAYITAAARCAPPGNRPMREELARCRPFLERELALLGEVKVVVALGAIAFQTYLTILKDRGHIASRAAFGFAHGAGYVTHPGGPLLLASYHPSQQNTSTGRLTRAMLRAVFARARQAAYPATGRSITTAAGEATPRRSRITRSPGSRHNT